MSPGYLGPNGDKTQTLERALMGSSTTVRRTNPLDLRGGSGYGPTLPWAPTPVPIVPDEPPPPPKLPPAELLPVLPAVELVLDSRGTSLSLVPPFSELHPASNSAPAKRASANLRFIHLRLDHSRERRNWGLDLVYR